MRFVDMMRERLFFNLIVRAPGLSLKKQKPPEDIRRLSVFLGGVFLLEGFTPLTSG